MTFTDKAVKVISHYLKLVCNSKCTIEDIWFFAKLIKKLPPLKEEEEHVSYDSIPIKGSND